ncbi:diadenylate cyclase [Candidatus Mycoplasma mahonii]|uniref:diadenylate cyclase n=1 Tax=Candidatus Mycoplasma mahonii TaxID=3004105 RepID=UPI0026EE1BC8|nr:DNA integrity scanning protein DisA nucleotide-binding domain protein [Candidatus Mycoplasma mahonii]WKX02514.1 DNA integrity scanning protein DisA nucleotide-binding domain protein [Candidatus Mycoplasma mahonii]
MTNELIFLTIIIAFSLLAFFLLLPWIINLLRIIFKKTNYSSLGQSSKMRLIHSLYEACGNLSENKTGAIITIINKQDLINFRTDGVKIDANISSLLIVSLFQKESPLHDGAILIENNKITYAGTYYKITSKSVDNKYGARHRAALGISEQTDALTIVVSEETGRITFAYEGKIIPVKYSEFQEKITDFLS